MKQIDLSNIPMKGKLRDWKNSIGVTCKFIYDDVEGNVQIVDYISDSHPKLKISYNEIEYICDTGTFVNVSFGKMLKKITSEYKFNLNEIISSQTGELKIIDRNVIYDSNNHRWKEYEIQCLQCGRTRKVKESYLLHYTPNCLYCNKNIHTLEVGVNDVATLYPWTINYFQGGIKEAQQYQAGSGKKVIFKCPICNQLSKQPRAIKDLIKYHSIGCQCDGKMSFPELVMFNLLNQFHIEFQTQVTNMIFPWAGTKRYDFYLPKLNCIIETHGKQHYTQTKLRGRSLEEEQDNDKQKKNIAIINGISHYFEINCSESNINFILQSCQDSGLLDFLKISPDQINFENLYYNRLHEQILQCKEILKENPNIYYSNLKRILGLTHSYDLDRILEILQVKVKTNHQFKVNVYYDNTLLKSFPSMAAFKRESQDTKYYLSFNTLKKYIAEKKIYNNHYTYTLED